MSTLARHTTLHKTRAGKGTGKGKGKDNVGLTARVARPGTRKGTGNISTVKEGLGRELARGYQDEG